MSSEASPARKDGSPAVISLHHVSLIYPNGTRAIDDVTIDIAKGSFVFLVGDSGTGKSSLLRLLYREQVPTLGEVTVDGTRVDLLKRSRIPYLRRNVGVVFQDYKLLNDKTVWENVAFALQVTGTHTRELMRLVPRALNRVGLSHKGEMYPSELSGGEQQRTAIARALVNNPKILLCDEPTGNLDPANSTEIMETLLHINLKGTTVIVATHNATAVDRLRRRVVRLAEGKIVSDEDRGYYFLANGTHGGLGQSTVLPK
jgi:cell division transport system ATP-binding protein